MRMLIGPGGPGAPLSGWLFMTACCLSVWRLPLWRTTVWYRCWARAGGGWGGGGARATQGELGQRRGWNGRGALRAQVLVHIEAQSPDIGQGVHGMGTKTLEEIGAGDQGHMFGYATDETEQLMPLTHVLATQLGCAPAAQT